MNPTLSVIVSARDAQARLRECIESVLAQSPADGSGALDVDLILVDNGSADCTAAIIAEFTSGDEPRARAVRLDAPQPTSAARDSGVWLSRGRYLLFLDGHDVLVPGALPALAASLAEAGNPQVLLFDHTRCHWRTGTEPSGDSGRLARSGTGALPLGRRPWLLRTTPVLANRLVRIDAYRACRDLLGDAHDDAELSAHGSLLAAESIACLDRVCVRRHVPGTVRPPRDRAAEWSAQLLDQYERLFTFTAGTDLAAGVAPIRPEDMRTANREAAACRAVLFDVMVRHYLRVLAGSGLPPEVRARFFRRAARHFARYRPPGYTRPDGPDGVRHALLERGAYHSYLAVQRANRGRRRLLRTAGAVKRHTGAHAGQLRYRTLSAAPLRPDLAVFSAYWDRGVLCSPAAIAAKLAELAPHIRQVWIVRRGNRPLVPPGTDAVSPGDRRYWEVLARATYFVNNVNFPDALVKRQGQVHLQTHHGTPLKRMGIDQLDHPATSRGVDYDALLARCARWDYSLAANRHSAEVWDRAYPVGFTALNHGCPRNDVYYRATAADVRAARARLGLSPGTTALLYAPTHRDYEAGWTPRLDLERFAAALGQGFTVLVRGHYFYDRGPSPLTGLHRAGKIVDVSDHDSVEELALASDALLTDYSSLMFDYANLRRPILVLADDWETYTVTRGVCFDLLRAAPGVVARTQEELQDALLNGEWRSPRSWERLDRFRERFCEFDDGHAAERVVRRVFLGQPDVLPVVPLDRRTPAPTPEEAEAPAPDAAHGTPEVRDDAPQLPQ